MFDKPQKILKTCRVKESVTAFLKRCKKPLPKLLFALLVGRTMTNRFFEGPENNNTQLGGGFKVF